MFAHHRQEKEGPTGNCGVCGYPARTGAESHIAEVGARSLRRRLLYFLPPSSSALAKRSCLPDRTSKRSTYDAVLLTGMRAVGMPVGPRCTNA